jgi:TRAP-type mannitol/chloroaromatic compound transport system permease large subunit
MELIAICILVLSFFIFIGLGTPVAWSIALSSLLTLLVSLPSLAAVTTIAQRMATGLDSFALLAIPFFILSGQLMTHGGIAHRLIRFAKTLVGNPSWRTGFNQYHLGHDDGSYCRFCYGFCFCDGEYFRDLRWKKKGTIKNMVRPSTLLLPPMGLVIPPSNVLIVYSLASGGVSIAALFLAGYIPGLLTGLFLILVAALWAKRKGYPTSQRSSIKEGP